MKATDPPSTPLMIIGGGLVGLSLALMLARAGFWVHLFEAGNRARYDSDTRNTALSRKSVQIYSDFGIWECIAPHACPVFSVAISEEGGFGRATIVAHEEKLADFGAVVQNTALLGALNQAVDAHPNITLFENARLVDISLDGTAIIDQNGQTHTHHAPLIIAADGVNSPTRTLLGISKKTHDYQQSALVGVVRTDTPHQNTATERFSAIGPMALLPLASQNQDLRSVVWICTRGEEQALLADLAKLKQNIGQTFGISVLDLSHVGAWELKKVLSNQQVMGRVVLMGNAAHTLHPVAGQGFNLCLRDAEQLTHTLAKLSDFSAENLARALSDYTQLRLNDQRRVARFCDFIIWGFTHPSPVIRFLRNVGLIIFDKVPFIKPLVARYAMGLRAIKS